MIVHPREIYISEFLDVLDNFLNFITKKLGITTATAIIIGLHTTRSKTSFFVKGNVHFFFTTDSDAFEYYFFHFAYFLVNPGMQKVNNKPFMA